MMIVMSQSEIASLATLPDHGDYNYAVVVLPDGDVGEVSWSNCDEIHVVHDDRDIGRGYWVFPRSNSGLRLATPDIERAYSGRCIIHKYGGQSRSFEV